jgi:hypothetical protein
MESMLRLSAIVLTLSSFATGTALAQSAPAPGTISGRVIDSATGLPVPNVDVRFTTGGDVFTPEAETKTDAAGRYALSAGPGAGVVSAGAPGPIYASRPLTVGAGQDLTSIDLRLPAYGGISGRVLDENKAPVPGIGVYLLAREYSWGALRYVVSSAATTDERGRYAIGRLIPGRGYLLMVWSKGTALDAISNAPADPLKRKPVRSAMFYPGVSAVESAPVLILQPGEVRDGLDVTMPMAGSASFCIDGKALMDGKAGTNAAPLDFEIEPAEPIGREAGTSPRAGQTGPDGLFRICDLTRGAWRISARQGESSYPQFYGSESVVIADSDVHNVFLAVRPRISVPGEVVWDGPPPDKPVETKISIGLNRVPPYGVSLPVSASLPGEFSLNGFLSGEYAPVVWDLPDGTYVKDLTYGDRSVLHGTFRVGGSDGRLRVTIARDGGFIQARATDKDNNPLAGSWIVIIPVTATSDAMVAASYVSARTDQSGMWKSGALAPGKYYVLASASPPDNTPETIARIMVERLRANPIDVSPGNVTTTTAVSTNLN